MEHGYSNTMPVSQWTRHSEWLGFLGRTRILWFSKEMLSACYGPDMVPNMGYDGKQGVVLPFMDPTPPSPHHTIPTSVRKNISPSADPAHGSSWQTRLIVQEQLLISPCQLSIFLRTERMLLVFWTQTSPRKGGKTFLPILSHLPHAQSSHEHDKLALLSCSLCWFGGVAWSWAFICETKAEQSFRLVLLWG